MATKLSLKEQVEILPSKPGCYLFFNNYNQVLYVGKAKNLRSRVSSYFNKVYNYKTTRLVQEITRLETIITKTEKEALILEHNLIKQYKPKYNILLNDDKHYPYIVITKEEDPQYLYVRNIHKKYARYYGPFPEGSHAREIIKVLERLYPLRRCKGNLGKPCLYYHINQCSGACFKPVPKEYYAAMIKKVHAFFKGNFNETKELLEKRMLQAANNLQFEEAQKLKLLIRNLDWTLSSQTVEMLNQNENLDVISLYQTDHNLVLTTLFYRAGKLSYKDYEYYQVTVEDDYQELYRLYLQNIYQKNILPTKIIVNEAIALPELNLLFDNRVFHPQTRAEKTIMRLATDNSYESYLQSQSTAQRQLNNVEVLQELQNLLHLNELPYLIEMIDIANINDEFVTGGVIVYKNGRPSRNDYRKYNLAIIEQDDAHRIAAVVARRYQKAIETDQPLPNLIIMDGGIQQVNACLNELTKLNLTIPVIGLVKNDQHKTDHLLNLTKEKVYLNKSSRLFLFLTKIQDDVHHFAISSFRRRQTKALTTSILESVPGLGSQRIKALNLHFDSIGAMQKASPDELHQVLRSWKLVENLRKFLENFDK
ncbi:excinuclease ABC subunit C [Spiroplasma sp. NBRC 100390]|uniref:excinuclease ABC subunit UvrC n=1 Tax=unclassified Spiroplasma TaxID=2637901 RepID=UPI0008929F6B|nr:MULTISPECIES: excinuclease ABC subunit UvrC [unclassified Spiroplasma]AOX44015.1 excinuclease ABC subunit C [Spiroplasma sp. TU-14]APE13485.1 excinuclease ABC subunit C [Spiroplasma sp. NBRC 100390]